MDSRALNRNGSCRVAYVFVFLNHSSGIINKMDSYQECAQEIGLPMDFYWVTRKGNKAKNIRVLEIAGSSYMVARYLQAKKLNELTREYHKVILRYPLFDPVLALFVRRKKKIILEHHTKEVEELKASKDVRYWTERYFGRWIRWFGGLLAVTPELLSYEKSRSSFGGPSMFFPNSILVGSCPPGKISVGREVQMVMVSNFYPWHGVDLILDELERADAENLGYHFHFVGNLSNSDQDRVSRLNSVTYHGVLAKEDVGSLLERMDVGVDSFNMAIKGMRQSTSLKMREYLKGGLLVVTGCEDPAFPPDFEYIAYMKEFDISEIIKFVRKHEGKSRAVICERARTYIDSRVVLKSLYRWVTSC